MVKEGKMGVRVASWNLLLHLLILLIAKSVESRKLIEENPNLNNNILRLPSSSNNVGEFEGHDHHVSHIDHNNHNMDDTNVRIFFTMKDLKKGNTMPIYFPKKEISTSPHFLPRDKADSIPFSSKDLPSLLDFFSFSRDSPQGTAMAETLRSCEGRPIEGETKTCATSLESMLDFASAALAPEGSRRELSVVTTTYLTKSDTAFQNYTVLEVPEEVAAPKMVACHTMPYPYAVFYCHYQESENKVYKIRLGGDNGDVVEAVAVCHLDTSRWSPNHVSFRVLGVGPGTHSPVCHFFPADNLVWLAN